MRSNIRQNANNFSNDPLAKLQKLRGLLLTPGITSIQQARIFKLIQETELLIANNSGPSSNNQYYEHNNLIPQPVPIENKAELPQYITRNANSVLALIPTQQPVKNLNIAGDMSGFETDERLREREFEAELERRKQEFRRQQEQRRQEYLNKLREMETGNIDTLRMFGLNPNYTIEELKSAYKRMAMQTHPDRPGGNTEKFQLVTQCYMSLLERLKGQTPAKSAMDLRTDARAAATPNTYMPNQKEEGNKRRKNQVPPKFINPDGQGFNVKLFNKLYEENKIWDPNDDGYEDWLRRGDVDEIRKAPPVFSKSFNIAVFNSTFDDWREQQRQLSGQNGGQIQKYNRPQELISTSSSFTTLDGCEPIKDFTKSLDAPGSLNYSDLKAAYTGGCDMIDPRTVDARKEYRNVEELIRDRDRLDYVLSPEDAALEERYAREAAQREQERLSRLSARDNLIGQHYSQTHQRLIGRAPDSDNPAVALGYQPSIQSPNQLEYRQQPKANMLTSGRVPSITTNAGGAVGRLPPPVSPAAIAAATGQIGVAPALTYVSQANNLRARSGAR